MLRRVFSKLLLVAVAVFWAFSGVLLAQGRSADAFERVKQVQEVNTARLLAMEGVEGTAIGLDDNGRLAVKVFTDGPGVAGIPRDLDGVPVKVVVTGKFYAIKGPPEGKGPKTPKEEVDPTARFDRPVPIGVSTGNEGECSAGTIGCRVTDGSDVYALSNNHVYALENDAEDESDVLQPGLYDTGCVYNPDNVIGMLAVFETILFLEDDPSNTNTIDAAIALSSTQDLGNATPSDGYGVPKSTTFSASIGLPVQKYGRTTSLTKGIVSDVNFKGNIGYSSGTAYFVDQIVVYSQKGPFIKAGDSGSLLVTDPNREPVGLIFAGPSSGKYAIANPIDDVLSALSDITGSTITIDGN
jgi:hypothetical protein